jgi:hypothetical protein
VRHADRGLLERGAEAALALRQRGVGAPALDGGGGAGGAEPEQGDLLEGEHARGAGADVDHADQLALAVQEQRRAGEALDVLPEDGARHLGLGDVVHGDRHARGRDLSDETLADGDARLLMVPVQEAARRRHREVGAVGVDEEDERRVDREEGADAGQELVQHGDQLERAQRGIGHRLDGGEPPGRRLRVRARDPLLDDLLLHPAALGAIARHPDEAAQAPVVVPDGPDHHVGPEARAVPADAPPVVLDVPPLRGLDEIARRLARVHILVEVETGDVAADDLGRAVAADDLGAPVPREDRARRVEQDDRVVLDALDDAAKVGAARGEVLRAHRSRSIVPSHRRRPPLPRRSPGAAPAATEAPPLRPRRRPRRREPGFGLQVTP